MNRVSGVPLNLRILRLRPLLVVPFVLQIFVGVGLVGYLSFRNGQSAVNTVASQLRSELTTRIREKLQTYTETPHAINRLNAAAAARGAIDIDHFKGEGTFWQQVQIYPLTSYVYYGNEQGAFLGVGRIPGHPSLQLDLSGVTTHLIQYSYSMDAEGRREQLIAKSKDPYDPRVRPWYKAAKTAGQPVWSEIYLDFTTLLPTVTASVPVYDKTTGDFIGACATDLYLPAEVSKFLRELKIGKTGTAFIIERSGQLVATSSQEPMTRGKGEQTERLFATESANAAIGATAQYLKSRFSGFEGIEQDQQLDFSLNEQRQFVQVVPFQDRNLDWLIVLTIPESDFMGEINRQTNITILICLAALIAAIVGGIFTAGWIMRPIEQITRASKDMAAGQLDQFIRPSPITELNTLGGSFNGMAGQLKESFETLEDKVNERTAELATANEAIGILNERLKEENLRLGAELDVARQIQTMILPRPEELEINGLDIAGFMEPADEVGGDYYDVLQSDGHVLIGIGDVTGHGLESGLLMLMTQTAVRTLQESKQTDPVRFFDILNRTIYGNATRIDADKSLTLALLDYHDGTLRLSGQHESVIVVRAGGKVELVDTMNLGFPIGLDAEIADFIAEHQVTLQPGDGVVLYTDGITEARDVERKLYGLERLCDVVARNWANSAEEVRRAVIADVRVHVGTQRVFDDMTLLVLKQKPKNNGRRGEFDERI